MTWSLTSLHKVGTPNGILFFLLFLLSRKFFTHVLQQIWGANGISWSPSLTHDKPSSQNLCFSLKVSKNDISADVTKHIEMVLALTVYCNANLDKQKSKKWIIIPMISCSKNRAHESFDGSTILEKYIVKIKHSLEIRPNQRKSMTFFLMQHAKIIAN